jgi:hypothetical protein
MSCKNTTGLLMKESIKWENKEKRNKYFWNILVRYWKGGFFFFASVREKLITNKGNETGRFPFLLELKLCIIGSKCTSLRNTPAFWTFKKKKSLERTFWCLLSPLWNITRQYSREVAMNIGMPKDDLSS